MLEYNNLSNAGRAYVYQSLTLTFGLGFKFLAWINCLGVSLVVLCALGLFPVALTPYLLRLPLIAFACGIAFCGLGLMWSYLVQGSLIGQLVLGEVRRTHWVPMFCVLIAYGLSLLAFIVGCWFLVNLAGAVYQGSESDSGNEDSSPWDRFGQSFEYDATENTVIFDRPSLPML